MSNPSSASHPSTVDCSFCKASAGNQCHAKGNPVKLLQKYHSARLRASQGMIDPTPGGGPVAGYTGVPLAGYPGKMIQRAPDPIIDPSLVGDDCEVCEGGIIKVGSSDTRSGGKIWIHVKPSDRWKPVWHVPVRREPAGV